MKLTRAEAADSEAHSEIAAILNVIREGERFLVCSHAGPDGDAVGSMLAMGMLLERLGKRAHLVSADRVPLVHRWLPGADGIEKALRVHGHYDAVILLECDGVRWRSCYMFLADGRIQSSQREKSESHAEPFHLVWGWACWGAP